MTLDEARAFLARGRARYDRVVGWQIAHEVQVDQDEFELEWFSVTEADAQVLDEAARRRLGEEPGP